MRNLSQPRRALAARSRLSLAVASLATVGALAGAPAIAAADKVEVRLATLAPDGSSWM